MKSALTQAELNGFLEKAADILRGNIDHSEFRGYVFALLFFKRISDVYAEEVAKLTAELGDEEIAKDPKMHNFVVPDDCLWDEVARKSRNLVGTALNDAMIAIERANQPKFDGILTGGIDFNDSEKLPRDKLIKLINHFSSQVFDHANVSDDVFGNAYEYLVRTFASKAALPPLGHRLGIDPIAFAQRLDRSLRSLYCCSDGVRRLGAPVKYLSHSVSLAVMTDIMSPPHHGTKHPRLSLVRPPPSDYWVLSRPEPSTRSGNP